jgi:hypothetical protein
MVTTTPRSQDSLKLRLDSNRISKLSYIWQREIFHGCTVSEVKAPLRRIMALVTHLQEDLARQWQGPMAYMVTSAYGVGILRNRAKIIASYVTLSRQLKKRLRKITSRAVSSGSSLTM